MLPRAVADHYRAQQRLIVAALGLTRREWASMDLADLDGSWEKIAPRVNLLTASAQLGSASNGAAYVGAVLDEYGESIDPLGLVDPRAFAGIASDGRPLDSLLEGAKIRAKASNSLAAGGSWLDMAVHTQVADAGRSAAAVSIAAHPGVGWVRMVNPPCCGPCAVLAGREYRYNQGFQRHPRCDCVHVPTTLANPGSHLGVDPTLDQITDLTEGERKALLEGADLSRVINARRGGGVGKMTTTELAKRGRARLTPDGIFAKAGNDRAEVLRLLESQGYITSTGRRMAVREASTPPPTKTLQQVVRGEVDGITDKTDPARLDVAARLLDELTTTYGVPVEKFGIGGTAKTGRLHALGDASQGGEMRYTAKAFDRGSWQNWEKSIQGKGANPDAVSLSELEKVIVHEYGHLIDYYTGQRVGVTRIAKRIAKSEGVTGSDFEIWLRNQISNYGRTSREESVAEAFLDVYANGPKASRVAQEIVADLLKRLKTGPLGWGQK